MTIICAQKTETMVDGKRVYGVMLGADNYTSDGARIIHRSNPKIYNVSPRIAMGSSGHVRLCDMLRAEIADGDFPQILGTQTAAEYEPELGKFFRDFLKDEFRAAKDQSLWTIVAVDDEIFDVGPDGSVVHVDGHFMATGNVERLALGALYAIDKCSVGVDQGEYPDTTQAKKWLRIAMEACAEFDGSIRPPWTFVSTTKPQ